MACKEKIVNTPGAIPEEKKSGKGKKPGTVKRSGNRQTRKK